MALTWSDSGESFLRLGPRGGIIWEGSLVSHYVADDGTILREPVWAIQYSSRWPLVMGRIPLWTVDLALARRQLRSWAQDFDRNEIDGRLKRDAEKRRKKQ